MRRATAAVLLTSLLLSGCGGGDGDDEVSASAPSPKPSPSADPKGDWLTAVAGLCHTLSGEVSGAQIQNGIVDGKYSPEEILAMDKAARPAVDAFDKGLAALPAPPEAAEAEKALKDLMALNKPTVVELLAAAQAGDQKQVNAVLSKREKIRLSPQGIPALTGAGLPEKCNYRMSYS